MSAPPRQLAVRRKACQVRLEGLELAGAQRRTLGRTALFAVVGEDPVVATRMPPKCPFTPASARSSESRSSLEIENCESSARPLAPPSRRTHRNGASPLQSVRDVVVGQARAGHRLAPLELHVRPRRLGPAPAFVVRVRGAGGDRSQEQRHHDRGGKKHSVHQDPISADARSCGRGQSAPSDQVGATRGSTHDSRRGFPRP